MRKKLQAIFAWSTQADLRGFLWTLEPMEKSSEGIVRTL